MVVLLVGTVLKGVPGDCQQRARGPAGQPGHVRPAKALLSPHLAVGPGHLQRRRLVGPDEPLHPRHVQHRQRTGDGFWKTDRRAAEDDRLPGGGGLGLLAALAALADRRPGGRAGHPLAEQDAQAGQSPGDGADGADLQRPGRDLPRHQDRQGLHQRALRAQAVPPPQQGILPQVDEDRPLRFPLAPHYRVHGHPHRLPGAVGRDVAGAQGRNALAGHPA